MWITYSGNIKFCTSKERGRFEWQLIGITACELPSLRLSFDPRTTAFELAKSYAESGNSKMATTRATHLASKPVFLTIWRVSNVVEVIWTQIWLPPWTEASVYHLTKHFLIGWHVGKCVFLFINCSWTNRNCCLQSHSPVFGHHAHVNSWFTHNHSPKRIKLNAGNCSHAYSLSHIFRSLLRRRDDATWCNCLKFICAGNKWTYLTCLAESGYQRPVERVYFWSFL